MKAQVEAGMRLAAKAEGGELLVVCGSVFLMSEARLTLEIEEPRDPENITNGRGRG